MDRLQFLTVLFFKPCLSLKSYPNPVFPSSIKSSKFCHLEQITGTLLICINYCAWYSFQNSESGIKNKITFKISTLFFESITPYNWCSQGNSPAIEKPFLFRGIIRAIDIKTIHNSFGFCVYSPIALTASLDALFRHNSLRKYTV